MAAPKILCDTAGMDRKTWLAVRAHGPDGSIPITIGGSDVAAIFGISPWKTPLDLWLEKSGKLLPNESENLWQKEIGHLLEPVVAKMYAFRTGHRVIPDTYLYQHALYPWALANVDYSMEDKDTKEAGGLECKTTTYHNADEWTDDKVPMHYEYQCRFYMGVRDLPFWDIACMWGNGEKDFPIRRIYRDFAIEEMIFETIAAFIQSIHDNQPPSMADVAPALAMKSLARIYAAGTLATPTIEFGRKHKLNPPAPEKPELAYGKRVFRQGDKVMQTQNMANISNGDMGIVTGICRTQEESRLYVDFGDGRTMEYAQNELDALDLAYATTVHKSQGSEYDTVILSLQTAHYIMLRRPLLYTAITRAKRHVIIVGERKALVIAIGRADAEKRGTMLAERINEAKTAGV